MIERVADFLRKYNLQNKTIIVGFSGGYDSMCLLDILSRVKKEEDFTNLQIIAAHFNHNWRGPDSLKEQEVCRIFAASKNLEFYTQTADCYLKKTENDARIARYEFFDDAIDIYDADALLTAHNKDDNAETVLYRIVKGTGLIGLKGISERRGKYYRPLLTTTRAEISAYCDRYNLTPNIDSSNADIKYNRNYIRHRILPALSEINPSVKDALNTLSKISEDENNIIDEFLEPLRNKIFKEDKIISAEFRKLSRSIKLRLIHEYIQMLGLDYDYKKITDVYNFIEKNIIMRNGSTKSLATALWLYVDDNIIEPIPSKNCDKVPDVDIIIKGEGKYKIYKDTLVIKPFVEKEFFVFPEATANFVYVDLSSIKFPLHIRTRKDGDIINPFGMEGKMKLKKYLNSKGIARHKRDSVLLLADDEEILWGIGVGLSNKISVKTQPTHVIELITENQKKENL